MASDFQRDVQHGVVVIPGYVKVERQCIVWKLDYKLVRWKAPSPEILDEFAALWRDENPNEVVKFVKRWGALRVDFDGKGNDANSGAEPLGLWWLLSRRAYAILNLASAISRGKSGAEDDWEKLSSQHHGVSHSTRTKGQCALPDHARLAYYPPAERRLMFSGRSAAQHARSILASEVSAWLNRFPVGLRLDWQGRFWRLTTAFDGGRALSVIALQLALRVANAASLYNCSWCGALYIRHNRKPNEGQKNYCPDCVAQRVPQRVAEAASRERKRK